MKSKRVIYTFTELSEKIPELSNSGECGISESFKNGILDIIDNWAEQNLLELFNIVIPYPGAACFIFDKLPDAQNNESDKKPVIKCEQEYKIPASKWTSNGLIELEVLIPKSITKEEYMLTLITLDDVVYDNKVVFARGSKIRYYSTLYDVKKYDNNYEIVKIVLDIRPTSTFGSDYISSKMSDFSLTVLPYTIVYNTTEITRLKNIISERDKIIAEIETEFYTLRKQRKVLPNFMLKLH